MKAIVLQDLVHLDYKFSTLNNFIKYATYYHKFNGDIYWCNKLCSEYN
jgi:hypothetical protein